MALLDELHENLRHEIDKSNSIDEIEGIGGYIQTVITYTDKMNTLGFRDRYLSWFDGLMNDIEAKERKHEGSGFNTDDLRLKHAYGVD